MRRPIKTKEQTIRMIIFCQPSVGNLYLLVIGISFQLCRDQQIAIRHRTHQLKDSEPRIAKNRFFRSRSTPKNSKFKLPKVSYGDFSSAQLEALTMVLLWLALNHVGSALSELLQVNTKDDGEFNRGGSPLELWNGTLVTFDRARAWLRQHAMEATTAWGRQIDLRLLMLPTPKSIEFLDRWIRVSELKGDERMHQRNLTESNFPFFFLLFLYCFFPGNFVDGLLHEGFFFLYFFAQCVAFIDSWEITSLNILPIL